MSVYSELLKAVLAGPPGERREEPPGRLVAEALRCRTALARSSEPGRDAGDRLADSLAYDAALVRLCRRLGIAESLTTGAGGPGARIIVETRLADRLPSLEALRSAPSGC